jgi:DinB superfamily
MSALTIRPAYSMWPYFNAQLRDMAARMTAQDLATAPSPGRWPMWATIGHLACQRVFWLCDAVDEPGAETTPFTEAGSDCPGDDDLEHVLGPQQLADALESTFAIVEARLDGWSLEMLSEEVRHPDWDPGWVYTRGSIIQRVYAHDVSHASELNEVLGRAGLAQMDLWDW